MFLTRLDQVETAVHVCKILAFSSLQYGRRILVSERTHFDKASVILDSNSQETKRGPRDGRGEAKRESTRSR